ncbi:MAG: hypothetical protein PVJ73_01150 [Acidobacteriota bacterium]|jgi:hypothetical protein|nr:hypothetical protein [Acidobacteriota bacterium]
MDSPTSPPRGRTFPLIAAAVLLAGTLIHAELLVRDALPRIAPVLAAAGATFFLPTRFAIATAQWWFVVVPVAAAVLAYVGLYWKRDRGTGLDVVTAIAVVFALFVQTVLFLALLQAAEHLPPAS